MKCTFNSTNQFWTEIALSAGLIGDIGDAASSCLSANEIQLAQRIKVFGVANSYWRPEHINQFMTLLHKVLTRKAATTD